MWLNFFVAPVATKQTGIHLLNLMLGLSLHSVDHLKHRLGFQVKTFISDNIHIQPRYKLNVLIT